jgi:hypothetical protein
MGLVRIFAMIRLITFHGLADIIHHFPFILGGDHEQPFIEQWNIERR